MDLDDLKKEIIRRINKIKFNWHFRDNFKRRPYLNHRLVISALKRYDDYKDFQIEEVKKVIRYRLGIKLSRKYVLVIILEIHNEHLYIITAWSTDRKWQKTTLK